MILTEDSPRLWLAQGKRIAVTNAPTCSGPVAYEILSDVDHAAIRATVALPSRKARQAVLLRLRHPDAAPLRSVKEQPPLSHHQSNTYQARAVEHHAPPNVMNPNPRPRPSRRRFLRTSSAAIVGGALAAPLGLPSLLRGADGNRKLTLGLISAATYGYMGAPRTPGSNHGTAFATACNGYDEGKRKQFEGTFVAARKRLEGVQVVRLWDPVKAAAERLADVCGIPKVCDSADECAEGVDAVAIVDDGSGEQSKYALTPLRKGVPTFCDKPLAMTARQAKEVATVARRAGTPFMSASALRFVPDIVALAREAPALGQIHLATTICGNELVYYGIHALEMAYAVLGRGAVSCLNVGQPDRNLVRVRFENGRDLMLMVAGPEWMSAGYQLNLYGSKGWRTVTPNLDDLYWYLLDRFVALVRTGKESVPIEEEVEVIAVLEAGKRSLVGQRAVTVAEVLAGEPLLPSGPPERPESNQAR